MRRINELPKIERPRERLVEYGANALSNQELLAVILKTGYKGVSVLDLAYEILKEIDIKAFKNITVKELMMVKGIGYAKAIEIVALIEFSKRIFKVDNKIDFKSAKEIFEAFKYDFNTENESFVVLYMDNMCHLIMKKVLFNGSNNKSFIDPKTILHYAIRLNASGIILIHNHPSGNINPSNGDIIVTKKIIEAANLVGVEVLDHIIFGDEYFSFNENKML